MGEPADAQEAVRRKLASLLNFSFVGNPDFWQAEFQTLGIEEARAIREEALREPLGAGRKIFFILFWSATREAQNALLKTFEEPAPGRHFFLFVPSADILLPTLRSRLLIISGRPPSSSAALAAARSFLAQSAGGRFREVDRLLKEAEERGGAVIAAVLDGLERSLASGPLTRAAADGLAELFFCRRYARDRAASFKLVLSHLALVLPKMQ